MLKEVKIELTNRCMRNCLHCSSRATNDKKYLEELSFDDVARIILEAKEMGAESIVFTGGEPLMYKNLDLLISLASGLDLKTTIYTFAYKTKENLRKYRHLINAGLDKIIYSLADTLSLEDDLSEYTNEEFFDKVFKDNKGELGFHYALSKDSFKSLPRVLNYTLDTFKDKHYFDKVSILRFVPHGKGTMDMDLSKKELLELKKFYLNSLFQDKIRLGSPWNILGIQNSPCVIADEIMIIGFDGVAYPCDSVKYFKDLGISGNIKDNSLLELYNSEYFKSLREVQKESSCSECDNYDICKGGCLGQKIIASQDKSLKRILREKDPKCMR